MNTMHIRETQIRGAKKQGLEVRTLINCKDTHLRKRGLCEYKKANVTLCTIILPDELQRYGVSTNKETIIKYNFRTQNLIDHLDHQ